MSTCVRCGAHLAAGGGECPACSRPASGRSFLGGLAAPGEPLEKIEDWVSVMRAGDPMEAHLAAGYLESLGLEVLVYPLQEATGFEQLPAPGIADMLEGPHGHGNLLPIHVLVQPEEAAEALEALVELRDHPQPPDEDAGK